MLKKSMVVLGLLLLTALPQHAVAYTNKASNPSSQVTSFTGARASNLSVIVSGIPPKATVVDDTDTALREIDLSKVYFKLYFSNGSMKDTGELTLSLIGTGVWAVKIPYNTAMQLNPGPSGPAQIVAYNLTYYYYDPAKNMSPGTGASSKTTLAYAYTDSWTAPLGIAPSVFKINVTDPGMRIAY